MKKQEMFLFTYDFYELKGRKESPYFSHIEREQESMTVKEANAYKDWLLGEKDHGILIRLDKKITRVKIYKHEKVLFGEV